MENNMPDLNENASKIEFDKVVELDIDKLEKFKNHPFKIVDDESMLELSESIKEHGVLNPSIVRLKENGNFEIVSGHRRKRGTQLAGLSKMPCIIRNLTDDEAIILMVDSNIQREKWLISERAFAYKMKYEALKHQGKRKNLTSDQLEQKLRGTRKELAKEFGESEATFYRIMHLTCLNKQILYDYVDIGRIKPSIAFELSFLNEKEQNELLNVMQEFGTTPSLSQAQDLKKLSYIGELTEDAIFEIMEEEKGEVIQKYQLSYARVKKYVPRDVETVNEVEEYLLKCAKYCKENRINVQQISLEEQKKKKDRDAR